MSFASADRDKRFALFAWGGISLLGVFALLANAPAPRRIFLLLALVACAIDCIRQIRIRPVVLLFMPWLAVVLLSAAWSPAPTVTLVDALQEVVSPLAAGLLAASVASRLEWRHVGWLFGVLALGGLLAALGALHVHTGFWPTAPAWLRGAYAGRGVASTLGVFLVLAGGSLLVVNRAALSVGTRGMLLLGGGLLLVGMLLGMLGHNRMFWFALLVGTLPWLILAGRISWKRQLAAGGSLLVLFMGGMAYSSYFAKAQSDSPANAVVKQIGASYASDPRWLLWQSWVPVIAERPLLGFGYGSRVLPLVGAAHVSSIGNSEPDEVIKHHTHNVLFNTVVQTGFVGLAAFLLLLFGVWRWIGGESSPADDVARKWRLAAISVLIGGLAKSMTDDFFWGPAGIVMWLLIGTMVGLGRRTGQR